MGGNRQHRLSEPYSRPRPRPLSRLRSEEHTSELQSPCNLVCRLLLEKKKAWMSSRPRTRQTSAPTGSRGRQSRNHEPPFFCKDTATTEIYTLSLHDALPISAIVPP